MNEEHISLIKSYNDQFDIYGKDQVDLYPDLNLVNIEFHFFEMYKYNGDGGEATYVPAWRVVVIWSWDDYSITPIREEEYNPDTFIDEFSRAVSDALGMASPYIYRTYESALEAVTELKRIEEEWGGNDENEDNEGNGENI